VNVNHVVVDVDLDVVVDAVVVVVVFLDAAVVQVHDSDYVSV